MKQTSEELKHVQDSIAQAEQMTSAEFVLVIQEKSDGYRYKAVIVGLLASISSLAYILFSEIYYAEIWVIPIVLLIGINSYLISSFPFLLRWMISKKHMHHAVTEAAYAAFTRKGVYHTRRHTGILLYLSLFEKESRIIFDTGVIDAVPEDVRQEWRRKLSLVALNFSMQECAQCIREISERAGLFLPRLSDDVNELQDSMEYHESDGDA